MPLSESIGVDNCPACDKIGRILQVEGGWAIYYHCDACNTAWLIDKRASQAAPVLIATPKKDRRHAAAG
jgi:hypothetical protein